MKTLLFPGTFDPFTIGHRSIVDRASALADRLIVAVGRNDSKHTLFAAEQRAAFIRTLYARQPRVEVALYDGLTVDFARTVGADAILRGIRTVADFEYERNMADVNRALAGVETVLLLTEPAYAHISSSIVRELIRHRKPTAGFVPDEIEPFINPL